MLVHSEDRSRMPVHRSSSELLQNDRPGNRRWSADTRPGRLTGRHTDRHLRGRTDTGYSNPSHLSGRLSPGYPVPSHLSGRLSPGYPVPSHLSGRLSPGYPVTSHLSGRLSPGYPVPSHLSGRLSPGYPVPSHLSRRFSPDYPVPSHLSGRLSPGYPVPSHLSGRPATGYPTSSHLSGRSAIRCPSTSPLSGRPAIRCPSTGPLSGRLDILNGNFANSRPDLGEGPLGSSFSGKVANTNQSIREPLMHWTGNAEQQNNIHAALNCQPSLNFESFQRTSFLSNIRQQDCHPENSSYRYVTVITVTVTKYPLTSFCTVPLPLPALPLLLYDRYWILILWSRWTRIRNSDPDLVWPNKKKRNHVLKSCTVFWEGWRLPLELGFLHRGFWKILRCFVPKIDFPISITLVWIKYFTVKNF